MKLYERYIISNIVPVFLLVTFSITMMVWLAQMLKILPLVAGGSSFITFCYISLLTFPSLLFILIPFTYCISVIYCYYKLQSERELTVLQNSSLSARTLTKPALYLAIILMLINYTISFYFLPLSYGHLKQNIQTLKNKLVSNVIQSKVLNSLSKNIILYVDEKHSDGAFAGIILVEKKQERPVSTTFARKGYLKFYDEDINFKLHNGIHQSFNHLNQFNTLNFDELSINISTKSSYKLGMIRGLQGYYFSELWYPDKNVDNKFAEKMRIELHHRILWPLYVVLLPMISLVLFFRANYSRKNNYQVVVKILAAVSFVLILHFTCNHLLPVFSHYIFFLYCVIFALFMISILFIQRRVL